MPITANIGKTILKELPKRLGLYVSGEQYLIDYTWYKIVRHVSDNVYEVQVL